MQNYQKKHIFLTGFMGAGKSKIGKLLAEKLSYPFYDSDKLIEQDAGKSVKDIFEQNGESHFRELEVQEIKNLCARTEPSVIALGGGALNNLDNLKLVDTHGISIYIKSSPESIFERVKHSKKRPLLNIEEGENFKDQMLNKIKQLLDDREKIYQKADIVFIRDGLELENIVDVLSNKISAFRK